MLKSIIDPNKSYTFNDYFELNIPIADLLAYFGYTKQNEQYQFAKSTADLSSFAPLKEQLVAFLRITNLTTEASKREVLIAPILLHLGVYLQATLEIEYPLNVSKQLKGKLDYYLPHKNNLLIIEAKHDDLARGFTQLAVELIALDKWLDEDGKPLHGAVSIGNVWQFAILNRTTKLIIQDINLYRVPADLFELLQILIAILTNES